MAINTEYLTPLQLLQHKAKELRKSKSVTEWMINAPEQKRGDHYNYRVELKLLSKRIAQYETAIDKIKSQTSNQGKQ